jgi:hypothetical protein
MAVRVSDMILIFDVVKLEKHVTGAAIFNIMTLSLMTLSKMDLFLTLNKTLGIMTLRIEWRYIERRDYLNVLVSGVIFNAIITDV